MDLQRFLLLLEQGDRDGSRYDMDVGVPYDPENPPTPMTQEDRDAARENVLMQRISKEPTALPGSVPARAMPNRTPDLSPKEMDMLRLQLRRQKEQSLRQDSSGMTQLLRKGGLVKGFKGTF